MFEFINKTLSSEYDKKNELVLASGDFNIPSFKMPSNFEKALMDSNPKFRPSIDLLNVEYETVLLKKLVDKFPQFKVRDLVSIDFPGQEIITYGDFILDKKGKEIPKETVLTAEIEFVSKQGLDYIFHFHDLEGKNLRIKKSSTKVEEFLVSDLIKSKHLKEDSQRPYG